MFKEEIDYDQKLGILEGVGKELLDFSRTCNFTEILEHYHILSETAIEANKIAEKITKLKSMTDDEKFTILNQPFYIEDEYRDNIVKTMRKNCGCNVL